MSDNLEDTGVIEAVLARLNQYRLPRLLELKERVDQGGTITDSDLDFLERIMADAHSIQSLVSRHPEVQPLYAQVAELYTEITARAIENEEKSKR